MFSKIYSQISSLALTQFIMREKWKPDEKEKAIKCIWCFSSFKSASKCYFYWYLLMASEQQQQKKEEEEEQNANEYKIWMYVYNTNTHNNTSNQPAFFLTTHPFATHPFAKVCRMYGMPISRFAREYLVFSNFIYWMCEPPTTMLLGKTPPSRHYVWVEQFSRWIWNILWC